MMSKNASSSPRSRDLWIVLGLLVLSMAPYAGVLSNEFVNLDDRTYVVNNAHVNQGLTADGLKWAWTTHHGSNWHPVTWISHMFDCEMFGLDPAGHHAVNVMLHGLNALLLFVVLRRATSETWPSALVAALFAAHPLRVESVAWISERKDVLSGLFFMLTLLAYLAYTSRPGIVRYLAVLIMAALGLASKSMLVTLPCVLLLLDYWPLGRWRAPEVPASRLVLEKLPLVALSVAASWATMLAQGSSRAMGRLEPGPLVARAGNAAIAYVSYLGKAVWPTKLACFYPHPAFIAPERASSQTVLAVGAAVLLAAVTGLVLWWSVGRRYPLVGWFWYLGMLVPVVGLVQVGSQAMADRYTYLPLIGISILVAWGLRDATVQWPKIRPVAVVAVPLTIAVLAVATWRQTHYWKSTRTLAEHALQVTRNNYVAHFLLAGDSREAGDLDAAERHLRLALEIAPSYARAHQELGGVLADQDRHDEAIIHFETAIQLWPDYAVAHYNLGVSLARKGQIDRALEHYEQAVRIRPDYAAARNNLGNIYLRRGDPERAAMHYESAIHADPDNARARANLGLAREFQGEITLAEQRYREALRIEPGMVGASVGLCRLAARQGRADLAAERCEVAFRRAQSDPGVQASRGLILDEQGRDGQAAQLYRRALAAGFDAVETKRRLAWILGTTGAANVRNGEEAVRWAGQCVEAVDEPSGILLETMAAAYAELGAFDRAVEWQARAVEASPGDVEARQRLSLYRAGRPYRDSGQSPR
jgi:tetratricopeptide (TPR) repeat protein